MSVVEIVSFVVAGLAVASRFVQAAKPMWDRLPKPVAIVLPAVVAMIPQVSDLLGQSKSSVDLLSNAIAAIGIVVVGLFPSKAK